MKKCTKCGVEKALLEYSKDSRNKSGLQTQCRECRKPRDGAASKRYRNRHPERVRAGVRKSNLKYWYGITPDEKEALIEGQLGCCACCGDSFSSSRKAHVDHVHGSDPIIIRGILCSQCNTGLGLFKDSPERMLKAAAYLKKFQKSP